MSTTTTLEHVVDIEASPPTVFELWTTEDGLRAWWANDATVDARPGGALRVDIDGEHIMVGEFLELAAPHLIRFTFGWEHDRPEPGSTEVVVAIEAVDGGSRLRLRHHGLPVDRLEAHARGWQHFLGERLAATGDAV